MQPSSFRLVRRFLAARMASQAAFQTQAVAVGWLIYAITGSALDLGLIGLVQFVPGASLILIAGHVADRYPRRRVVLAALGGEMLCAAALAALALAGTRDAVPIFAVIACYGAIRAFEQPAMQSWLPSLAGGEDFPRAAAWNSLTAQTAVILGPVLGGLLYLLGPAAPFLCAVLLLGAGAVVVAFLPAPRPGDGAKLSWDAILGGLRFIRANDAVRGAITLDLFCVLFGGAVALLPIFARDILAIGPAGLGLLRAAPAMGALATGICLTRRPPQHRVGRRMMAAIAAYGVATLVFALSRSPLLSLLALMGVGAADMLSIVIRTTMIQVVSPDRIRGRVTAVNSLFTGASNQLGQFESGVTAAWFGPVGSVVLGGLATLAIVALWSRRFPALREMDRLAPAADPG